MSPRWKGAVSLDLRSLALFRMLLGAYLLTDVLLRLGVVNMLYTDDGFLPRDVLLTIVPTPWLLSLHLSSGGMIIHSGLFLAALVSAGFVLAGYRTRGATIVSWVLFASMHARNPFVDGLAEDILIGLA